MEVHDQLARMHMNFEGLRGQFEVIGGSAKRAGAAMEGAFSGLNRGTRLALSRLEGQLAAKEDWGAYLWPEVEDET